MQCSVLEGKSDKHLVVPCGWSNIPNRLDGIWKVKKHQIIIRTVYIAKVVKIEELNLQTNYSDVFRNLQLPTFCRINKQRDIMIIWNNTSTCGVHNRKTKNMWSGRICNLFPWEKVLESRKQTEKIKKRITNLPCKLLSNKNGRDKIIQT